VSYQLQYACTFDAVFTALFWSMLDLGILQELTQPSQRTKQGKLRQKRSRVDSLASVLRLFEKQQFNEVRFAWARHLRAYVAFLSLMRNPSQIFIKIRMNE
jgi:hypothetical protein